MTVLASLRQLDPDALRVQSVLSSLLRCGVPARMAPVGVAPCLRFELLQQGCSLVCRLDAGDWAERHLPQLQGLDWSAMPVALLDALVRMDTPLDLRHACLGYLHARMLPPCATTVSDLLPALDAAEGTVWIEAINGALPVCGEQALPGQLPLPLAMRLGSLKLPLQRLHRLAAGDILLLPPLTPCVFSGRQPLFACDIDFEQETFTMTHPESSLRPTGEESALIDVGSVPIRPDVGFSDIEMTVAELGRLQAGSVMPLPANAASRIRISLNGRCIASGELVQVGQALGVQLDQAPRLV